MSMSLCSKSNKNLILFLVSLLLGRANIGEVGAGKCCERSVRKLPPRWGRGRPQRGGHLSYDSSAYWPLRDYCLAALSPLASLLCVGLRIGACSLEGILGLLCPAVQSKNDALISSTRASMSHNSDLTARGCLWRCCLMHSLQGILRSLASCPKLWAEVSLPGGAAGFPC
jgi:hypothetical protein